MGYSRRSIVLAITPIVLVSVAYLWLVGVFGIMARGPDAVLFGCDFGMFWAAARIVRAGGNPFIPGVLYHVEHVSLMQEGIHSITQRWVVRVGNPPLFFWLLGPIARLPYRQATILWGAAMYVCCGAGMWVALRAIDWRTRAAPLALFLLTPQVVVSALDGNVTPLVFVALALMLLLGQRAPLMSGAVGAVAWLKPSLALPFVALIILFSVMERRRAILGFCASSLAGLVLCVITVGADSLPQWARALHGYTVDMSVQPGIASLSGLYVRWLPLTMQSALELISVGLATALTLWFWLHRGRAVVPLRDVAWLWLLWFLAGPYSHFLDQILLALPLIALIGKDGEHLGRASVRTALYSVYGSLFLISAAPLGVQLLPVPAAIALAVLCPKPVWLMRVRTGAICAGTGHSSPSAATPHAT